ncbi:MAG: KH domain-containing protein, partial [Enterococcus casseliflavus]|nr:KH domain-containing protein [Enterococcus casseliflavus]
PEDIGRIIGKQGRVAKAIRTIVYSVRTNGPKKVFLSCFFGMVIFCQNESGRVS